MCIIYISIYIYLYMYFFNILLYKVAICLEILNHILSNFVWMRSFIATDFYILPEDR